MRNELVKQWFYRRFGRRAEEDKTYYNEWVQRFNDGEPHRFMDKESLRVYLDLLTEREPDLIFELSDKVRKPIAKPNTIKFTECKVKDFRR